MNAKLILSIAAAAFSVNAFAADTVMSSTPDSIVKSYGRAGGLVGADRIEGLQAGTTKVGVVFDTDVAARTNMQRTQDSVGTVGVAYDADVATRTNMPRSTGVQPTTTKAAGVAAPKTN